MVKIEVVGGNSRTQKKNRNRRQQNKPKRRNTGNMLTVSTLPPRVVSRAKRSENFTVARAGGLAAKQYMSTLLNPFTFGGIKLGWGCMTESNIAVLRSQFTATCNATDGSLSIIFNNDLSRVLNTQTGLVGFSNSGAGTAPSYSYPSFSGAATLNGLADSVRFISAGFRVLPSIALTSAPGQVCVTDVPSGRLPLTNTINNNITLSQTKAYDSRNGATWTWRPVDPDDFVFLLNSVASSTTTNRGTAGAISIINAPPSTLVFVEAVIHVEYLQGVAQPVDENRRQIKSETVADGGLTPEAFHAAFKQLPCNCPETPSGNEADLPNMLYGMAGHVARAGVSVGINRLQRSHPNLSNLLRGLVMHDTL